MLPDLCTQVNHDAQSPKYGPKCRCPLLRLNNQGASSERIDDFAPTPTVAVKMIIVIGHNPM